MGRRETGPVYQGRFKSFPVQNDDHFYTVCRYVERNALRAKLVRKAENWRWSSLWQWASEKADVTMHRWPQPRPDDWLTLVNQPQTEEEVAALQNAMKRGCPFGGEQWQQRTAKKLGLESTLRPRGRPRKSET
jgi:putative transposase